MSSKTDPKSDGIIQSTLNSISWSLDITVETYVYILLIPAVIIALLLSVVGGLLQPFPVTVANAVLVAFGWFIVAVATFYPYVVRSEESKEIKERFHFFITYFSALSLSSVNRMEVFRKVAEEESHGVIGREIGRVVTLVDTWNMSLSEACLTVSKGTSSDLLSGLLERLSHNVDSGSGLESFLKSEQEPILEKYSARYEADLDRIEIFAESYLSLMIGLTFGTVFGMIAPFLAGFDPITVVGGLLGGFLITQVLFGLIIQSISPEDHLWYDGRLSSKEIRTKKLAIIGGVSLTFLLVVLWSYIQIATAGFDGYLYFASAWATTIPSLIGGVYVTVLESRIFERDNKYPGLIRSIGSTENVKRASTRSVLRDLTNRDFGRLTEPLNNLYRRLFLSMSYEEAWEYFSADSGSFLIHRFTDMYHMGRYLGADTEELGEMISRNFETVLQLRESRKQTTSTLIGLVYGVTAVSSFAFFVTIEVVRSISDFQDRIDVNSEFSVIQFVGYDIGTIETLVLVTLFLTAISSAVIIKLTQRRSYGVSMLHFSLLFLVCMVSGIAVDYVTEFIEVLET